MATFVAHESRFVASWTVTALRRGSAAARAGLGVGRPVNLQKAQKLGLGALALLMGASLFAMRPHDPKVAGSGSKPQFNAAHLKLAAISPAWTS